MQKQLFRQYDIRGKIGTEFAIDDFFYITHALIRCFQQQGCDSIILGMDGRVHGPMIRDQVVAACKQAGIDVYDIGLCSTPIALFTHYRHTAQACIMITASHNPAEYNGLKLYYKTLPIEGALLQKVYDLYAQKIIVKADHLGLVYDLSGSIGEYVDSLATEFVALRSWNSPVYIDCGNGTGGPILHLLIEKMGWKHVKLLYEQVDGMYPNHPADPTNFVNMQDLYAVVCNNQGSFGIGLDGDCDRVGVVTCKQKLLAADQLLMLFARFLQVPVLVADIKSSSVLHHAQARVVLAKTGSANIKQAMIDHHALLGGELSGHFFFKDRHHGYDDGIYTMLRFFELLHIMQSSCDDLVASLPETFATQDIRIPCSDTLKFDIVAAVTAQIADDHRFQSIMIDGVRFQNENSWGLIRASNTQPVLSVCCQADSAKNLLRIKQYLISVLELHLDAFLVRQYLL